MIDLELRKQLADKQANEALFKQLGAMIEKSLQENNAGLKENFSKGTDNSHVMTKYLLKRLDIQILLLLQLHKDLKKLKK